MSEGDSNKRSREGDEAAADLSQKAQKWAETFGGLDEEDAYTYLEELAPHLDRMHVQFLQGIIGFDDEGEEEEDFGEKGEEGDEGEEGSEDDGEEGVPGDADGDDE